jgi:hypothetical protein
MSVIKKKHNRTKKPLSPYSAMFGFIGFQDRTYFNWANPHVFDIITKAKHNEILHS